MKNRISTIALLSLIVIMFSTFSAFSQWQIDEGFDSTSIWPGSDGYTPPFWTSTVTDDGEWLSKSGSGTQGMHRRVQGGGSYGGSGGMISVRYNADNTTHLLISPQVSISNDDSVSCWLKRSGGSDVTGGEEFLILVSTTGTEISDFSSTLYQLVLADTTGSTWIEFKFSLDDFVGQDINLAFVFDKSSSNSLFAFYIDEVKIGHLSQDTMQFSSTDVSQSEIGDVYVGATSQQVVGIHIDTEESLFPFDVSGFYFSTSGSTNPTTDILNAKVYYTGTNSSFSTENQFGTTYSAPNGSFYIVGSDTLVAGTNHFWLTYDVSSSAVAGNIIDAICDSVVVNDTVRYPITSNPTGSRTIVNPYDSLDLGIYSWVSPVTGTNLSNAEVVSVTVKNFGLAELDSFIVSYSVDNGSSYIIDTVIATIDINMNYTHHFSETVDFSVEGTYNCITTVGLFSIDINNENDTLIIDIDNSLYDVSIDTVWTKTFGGSAADHPLSLDIDMNDNIFVTGKTKSDDGDLGYNLGGYDAWTIKLNSSGDKQWSIVIGGSSTDIANKVMGSDDGGCLAVGTADSEDGSFSPHDGVGASFLLKHQSSNGSITDEIQGTYYPDGGGYNINTYDMVKLTSSYIMVGDLAYGTDPYIYRVDAAGVFQAQTRINNLDTYASFTDIIEVSDGVIALGTETEGFSIEKLILIKYSKTFSENGSYIWRKDFVVDDEAPAGLVKISDDEIAILYGKDDFKLMKVDGSGNLIAGSEKIYGGSSYDIPYAFTIDDNDNLYMLGRTLSDDYFGAGLGSYDFAIIKTDVNGNVIAKGRWGSSGSDKGTAIDISTTGEIIVAGSIGAGDGYANGHHGSYDYWVGSVSLFETPMSYVSSTSTQNETSDVEKSSTDQLVLGVEVITIDASDALVATALDFSTTATTNTNDILNAKVYYTGTDSSFLSASQFGSTVAVPGANFIVTGTQALSIGTNYFWLTYDVSENATAGNLIDAVCNTITIDDTARTPTITNPTGNRAIVSNSNNDIITFEIAEQLGVATIKTSAHTIAINVPELTNLTSIQPTITVSEGATVNPQSGIAQNFTNPVTYTVTAEDGTPQQWVVTVSYFSEVWHVNESFDTISIWPGSDGYTPPFWTSTITEDGEWLSKSGSGTQGLHRRVQGGGSYGGSGGMISVRYNADNTTHLLISPQVSISNDDSVSCWMKRSGGGDVTGGEEFQILASTSGTEISDFSSTIYQLVLADTTGSTWIEFKFSLEAFAGQDIYLAFVFDKSSSSSLFAFYIDEIRVGRSSGGIITTFASESINSKVNIYPNPASGLFNIQLSNMKGEKIMVDLYTVDGRKIYTEEFVNNATIINRIIDIKNNKDGVYYLRITGDEEIMVKKLINTQ